MVGQIFYFLQGLKFLHGIWNTDVQRTTDPNFTPEVDVFITVAGEPVSIVRETAVAAKNMDYPNFKVHILNDGYVAKKDNWQEIIDMAEEVGVNCITRKVPGGYKAGNINVGLAHTSAPFVTIFDADHVPHKDFLLTRIFSEKQSATSTTRRLDSYSLLNTTRIEMRIISLEALGISKGFSSGQFARGRIGTEFLPCAVQTWS
jgi:cellulose synthase/poly-beta-1,6-N-acetylglucosamine synthase-like glycosyltransferase